MENLVNGNKIIFSCLNIALWSGYNMNSDLLDGSKKWENFVNGNKIIFGCLCIALWSGYNMNSNLLDDLTSGKIF